MSDKTAMRRASLVALAILLLLLGATAALTSMPAGRWWEFLRAPAFHGRDVTLEHWDGAFALTDTSNRQRSLEDFRGKVVLLTFGYTQCPDFCPTTLAKFADVRRRVGADAARVQGVFVTVDPQRDTAALLTRYLPSFDPTFIGLRGTTAQTDAATRVFHASYVIDDDRGRIAVDHTAATYLIDPTGAIRVVAPADLSARALADDVGLLLQGR
jgi:protein SCO1/2